MTTITRFAPSPSGVLHLGHAFAALEARRLADADGGEMRLRIEDIDTTRCKPKFLDGIYEDLAFLDIAWDGPVLVQSERMDAYQQALDQLKAKDLIYPCYLSRRKLDRLLSAPHDQKTTRNTDQFAGSDTPRDEDHHPAWRLRMDAIEPLLKGLDFMDKRHGRQSIDFRAIGDEVIARSDIATSYHLSVVVDDAACGVTLVTRGEDLISATPLHRILQELLGLPETDWWHHPLVVDTDGRRLAKRDNARAISQLRTEGMDRLGILNLLEKSNFSSIY